MFLFRVFKINFLLYIKNETTIIFIIATKNVQQAFNGYFKGIRKPNSLN